MAFVTKVWPHIALAHTDRESKIRFEIVLNDEL